MLIVSVLTFTPVSPDRVAFPSPPTAGPLSPHLEEDGVDELSAETFRAFISTMRLHARLITRLVDEDEGVHPGQLFCLRVIANHDGIAQRDLAEELHVARPSVTRMLQGMERAGMVERRDDEHDQRLTRVYLTDRGRDFDSRFRHVAAAYVKDTIGRLPAADRRELIRLLHAFGETLATAVDARRCADGVGPSAARGDDTGGDL